MTRNRSGHGLRRVRAGLARHLPADPTGGLVGDDMLGRPCRVERSSERPHLVEQVGTCVERLPFNQQIVLRFQDGREEEVGERHVALLTDGVVERWRWYAAHTEAYHKLRGGSRHDIGRHYHVARSGHWFSLVIEFLHFDEPQGMDMVTLEPLPAGLWRMHTNEGSADTDSIEVLCLWLAQRRAAMEAVHLASAVRQQSLPERTAALAQEYRDAVQSRKEQEDHA